MSRGAFSWLLVGLCLVLLAGCGKSVRETRDGPPLRPDRQVDLTEPVPRSEPRSSYGNHSPYEVLGQTYHVLASASNYAETGYASWYGSKFHGRPTSSGEPFDMYRISAAHRTLPLPTYARVRNLENGKEITVRINDRGPFHPDRIIDLSYAAALKLGIVEAGVGRVEVRTIETGAPETASAIRTPHSLPVHVQVGAFSEQQRAREISRQLEQARLGPVHVERAGRGSNRVWRVRLGPLADAASARNMFERVLELGLDNPVYVYSN